MICFDRPSFHVDEDTILEFFTLAILNQSSTDIMFTVQIAANGTATSGKINHLHTYICIQYLHFYIEHDIQNKKVL